MNRYVHSTQLIFTFSKLTTGTLEEMKSIQSIKTPKRGLYWQLRTDFRPSFSVSIVDLEQENSD